MSDIIFKKQDNQTRDYQKFYVVKPDSNFNPDKNKKIVEDSIKKYEKKRLDQRKNYIEQLSERADAVYSYLKHMDRGHSTPIEKYFGKRTLAYLRGQKIVQTIRPDGGIVLNSID